MTLPLLPMVPSVVFFIGGPITGGVKMCCTIDRRALLLLPRPVARLNTFTNAFTSLPMAAEPTLELPDPAFARLDEPEEDVDDVPARASLMSCAVTGWKVVRDLEKACR